MGVCKNAWEVGGERRRSESGCPGVGRVEGGVLECIRQVALDLPHEAGRHAAQEQSRRATKPPHGPPWIDVAPARPLKVRADEGHQLLDRDGPVDTRSEVIAPAGGLGAGEERGHRVGHVIDGDDVERTLAVHRQRHQARDRAPPKVEGDQHLYRPVERLVARGLPADRVADDDRWPVDGDRQLATGVPAESFGLELALLVRVAEPLAYVELVLTDDSGTITGDVGRTHVVEAPFPALRTNAAAQQERLRGPADVPAPRLGKRKPEVRRRRDMDDAVDPLRERSIVGWRETEACLRHVAPHDAHALAVRDGQRPHQVLAAPFEGEVVARADQRDQVYLPVAGKEAPQYLPPKEARRPGDQRGRHGMRWSVDPAAGRVVNHLPAPRGDRAPWRRVATKRHAAKRKAPNAYHPLRPLGGEGAAVCCAGRAPGARTAPDVPRRPPSSASAGERTGTARRSDALATCSASSRCRRAARAIARPSPSRSSTTWSSGGRSGPRRYRPKPARTNARASRFTRSSLTAGPYLGASLARLRNAASPASRSPARTRDHAAPYSAS